MTTAADKAMAEAYAPPPNTDLVGVLGRWFDEFNGRLFGCSLPRPVLNMSRQRSRTVRGVFYTRAWGDPTGGTVHEISVVPEHTARSQEQVAATLVHEMVHYQQLLHGTPGKDGRHNREWAKMMDAVGLAPSSTGAPGGKRTGKRVTHYVVPGGLFSLAWAKMVAEGVPVLPLYGLPGAPKAKAKSSKVAYRCGCASPVYARPGRLIACGECQNQFEEQS